MREQYIEYRDGETLLEGFLCYDESQPGPRPAVLINHAWGGRDEFVERKARRLAWQGYACFALDNFGKGKRGTTPEECSRADDSVHEGPRACCCKRLLAGLATVQALPIVDARRMAVMGFCFGGLCALDLARSDADIRGAVSFHGMLKPSGLTEPKIRARVLMLHGYDDPMAPPEDVLAVAREFTRRGRGLAAACLRPDGARLHESQGEQPRRRHAIRRSRRSALVACAGRVSRPKYSNKRLMATSRDSVALQSRGERTA